MSFELTYVNKVCFINRNICLSNINNSYFFTIKKQSKYLAHVLKKQKHLSVIQVPFGNKDFTKSLSYECI